MRNNQINSTLKKNQLGLRKRTPEVGDPRLLSYVVLKTYFGSIHPVRPTMSLYLKPLLLPVHYFLDPEAANIPPTIPPPGFTHIFQYKFYVGVPCTSPNVAIYVISLTPPVRYILDPPLSASLALNMDAYGVFNEKNSALNQDILMIN